MFKVEFYVLIVVCYVIVLVFIVLYKKIKSELLIFEGKFFFENFVVSSEDVVV